MSARSAIAVSAGRPMLVLMHSTDQPDVERIRATVLARASELLAQPNLLMAGGKRIVYCLECGRQARPGTFDVCTWWPFGCQTGPADPLPKLCWDCLSDDQRVDLVEVGCLTAATNTRYQRSDGCGLPGATPHGSSS